MMMFGAKINQQVAFLQSPEKIQPDIQIGCNRQVLYICFNDQPVHRPRRNENFKSFCFAAAHVAIVVDIFEKNRGESDLGRDAN